MDRFSGAAIVLFLLLAAGSANALPQPGETRAPPSSLVAYEPGAPLDIMLGDPAAPVTIIEYGSVACPICARLNANLMPALIEKYIATGKVRLVYRPMLTGVPTVAAAGQMMAQCAGTENYFKVNDAVMRGQAEYYVNGETDELAYPVLQRIARSFGMDKAAFERCIKNPVAVDLLVAAEQRYLKAGIEGTPAFFVNNKRLDYKGGGIAEFDAAIAAASQ